MKLEVLLLLLITLVFVNFLRPALILGVERCFLGRARVITTRRFWLGVARSFFAYLLLPMMFGFFGSAISLLPNPQFRRAVEQHNVDEIQVQPYSGTRVPGWSEGDIGRLRENITIAIIGTLVIISTTRILIATYNDRLVGGLILVVGSSLGMILFTYLFDLAAGIQYYHTLYDLVLRPELPDTMPFLALGALGTCILTEYLAR